MANQWSEDLATGIEEIDEQHRELYATVASLSVATRLGMVDQVPVILDFLERYVTDHFALEEDMMGSAGYPGLPKHQAAHAAFMAKYLGAKQQFLSSTREVNVFDLAEWLGTWLRDHVQRMQGEVAMHLRTPCSRAKSEAVR